MHPRTNVCIVGASGAIGRRHAQHCIDEPLINLTCFVDPTPIASELAKEHGVQYFASVETMLASRAAGNVKVDGAILGTPNHTHVPLGIQMLEAGVHALVEKPVSTDVESGRALVAAAAQSDYKILVGHHRRFNPYIIAAKKIIDDGRVGQVLAVQGTWTIRKPASYYEGSVSWHREEANGGVILINLAHDIDLLRYLLGDIIRVYCAKGPSTRGFSVEETGAIVMTFASGAVGTFVFSDATVSPHNWEGATGENPIVPRTGKTVYSFFGTKGTVSVPDLKVHHYAKDDGAWEDDFISDPAESVDDTPPFTRQLQHFDQVCRGTAQPACSALEALKTIIVLDAVKESMMKGIPVDVAQG